MECGDRSWVRRAGDIFSALRSPVLVQVRFSISSRSRHFSGQNRGSVGIILPRCVVGPRSDLPESQSQSRALSRICARSPMLVHPQRTGPLRLYSVVLQHASLARVSSDVTGRLSQLCRAGSPAAAATQPSRPRRPPLAPGACRQRHTSHRAVAHTHPLDRNTSDSNQHCRARGEAAARKRSLILRGLKRHPRGRAFGGRSIVRSRGCRLSGVGAAQSALRLLHLERVAPLVSGQRCSRAAARRSHGGAPRRAARTHA